MGDRGNIKIAQDKDCFPHPVYFYGHWMGSEMKPILARALHRGRERWTDGSYLARIIFCEMIKGNEPSLTGHGISTESGDNEYPFLVVDIANQQVYEEADERENFKIGVGKKLLKPTSFEDFLQEFHEPKLDPLTGAMRKSLAKK